MSDEGTNIVNIGNNKYEVTTIPAMRGINFIRRLACIIGPAFKNLTNTSISENDLSGLTDIVGVLADNLTDDSEKLIINLMNYVFIIHEKGNREQITESVFDRHFARNYGDIPKLIVEVIKHNRFFDRLGLG